jgi:hypothetical protein
MGSSIQLRITASAHGAPTKFLYMKSPKMTFCFYSPTVLLDILLWIYAANGRFGSGVFRAGGCCWFAAITESVMFPHRRQRHPLNSAGPL